MSGREQKMKDENSKQLLEEILSRENLNTAYKRVNGNKGAAGIDGMQVEDLFPYLKENGEKLRQEILKGTYTPQPVRRVEIPKPEGGVRLLGIPTVIDRMIQQSIAQVISPIFERKFSENSYGFRPNRSAQTAIKKAEEYISEGRNIVVDIDLEKFFDRVNHDKLMYVLSEEITDKRVLKLIRRYLESGVMIGGLVSPNTEGTPQGGPISPLLSNVMLDKLDKELESKGHKFCRYADDCNIYVKSVRAGERVMKGTVQFIEKKLKLKVNKDKSAVDKVSKRKFLGITFKKIKEQLRIIVHIKSIKRFKDKIRLVTSATNGKNIEWKIDKLNQVTRGWVNYYGVAEIERLSQDLDGWIRRRLRLCFWVQWKRIKARHDNLVRLGTDTNDAWGFSMSRKGAWRIAGSPILTRTLTNNYFKSIGYRSLVSVFIGNNTL